MTFPPDGLVQVKLIALQPVGSKLGVWIIGREPEVMLNDMAQPALKYSYFTMKKRNKNRDRHGY
jgi:hypothetical protein